MGNPNVNTQYLQTGPANVYLREAGAGTIAVVAAAGGIAGTGTKFLTGPAPFSVGDKIVANGETHIIAAVTSDTAMTSDVWTASAPTATYTHDVYCGGLDDGVEVTVKTDSIKLTASQLGTSPADEVVTGVEVGIKVPFKEIRLESFKRAIASSRTVVDDTVATKRRLEVAPLAGLSLRSIAKRLTIVPLIGGVETTNLENIIVAPVAAPAAGTVKLAFSNSAQRMIEADFVCFPDITVGNGNRCLFMGDETAVDVVAPFGIAGV